MLASKDHLTVKKETTLLLGLKTFSYHLAFAFGNMDVLGFVQRSAELGPDGVQIKRLREAAPFR